jgi:methylphosphotriester-DNA--protein-cysteine methyltransferase
MDLVFSTDAIERAKRYAAWQGAICDVYVHVDVKSEQRADYRGFIREARFGAVTMTDILLSEQKITRRQRHGFNSSSHFSTAFRRKFGLRPSDVRRR